MNVTYKLLIIISLVILVSVLDFSLSKETHKAPLETIIDSQKQPIVNNKALLDTIPKSEVTSLVIDENEQTIDELVDNVIDSSLLQHKNNQPTSVNDEQVDLVLKTIPESYHILFKNNENIDVERIENYASFIVDHQETLYNADLEKQLTDFIYQHEISHEIELNRINCNHQQCEVLGIQKNSIAWVTIQNELLIQPWFTFKKVTDYQGHNNLGNMVFLTLFTP